MGKRGPRPKVIEIPEVGHAPMLLSAAQVDPVARFLRDTAYPLPPSDVRSTGKG
jgi:hypothetical protein